LLIVCHVDKGYTHLVVNCIQLHEHVLSKFGVERGQWLVEEQYGRFVDEGASDGDALSLSTRELGRLLGSVHFELHQREVVHHFFVHELLRHLSDSKGEGDILEYAKVRKERIALKDSVAVALVWRKAENILAINGNAPTIRVFEATYQTEDRRFATA